MRPNDSPSADLDELVELELQIARRADELRHAACAEHTGRNFWREAEEEIWNSRLPPLTPTSVH